MLCSACLICRLKEASFNGLVWVQEAAKHRANPDENRSFTIWSYGTVKIHGFTANFGTDNRSIFKTWFSWTVLHNLLSECLYDCSWRLTATLLTSWKENEGKAVRGRERERTHNDYLWPLDYVPVLGELQAFVGVLISRVCNQRNPFCCRAQPRPSLPSHQSSECLGPDTTNTVCHNFCVQFVFAL